MKAMILDKTVELETNDTPLRWAEWEDPVAGDGEIVLRVSACGVCHTELDEIEGRMPPPHLPVIPGHQVVGKVVARGNNAEQFRIGERVGVAWIYSACGTCKFCRSGRENLCPDFRGTGKDAHGGYAELMVVKQGFAHAIPAVFSDVQAAPLLCAGAIGYRSLRLSGIQDGMNLGLTGFGASGHLVMKMVRYRYPSVRVSVFARSVKEQEFARELGAVWTGEAHDSPPQKLDAIIDTTPAWSPAIEALRHLEPGGRLVINAIRKEDRDKKALMGIQYPTHLWMEKEIKSVANVTRSDVSEFLQLAAAMRIEPDVQEFALSDANRALVELKASQIRGAKVLLA